MLLQNFNLLVSFLQSTHEHCNLHCLLFEKYNPLLSHVVLRPSHLESWSCLKSYIHIDFSIPKRSSSKLSLSINGELELRNVDDKFKNTGLLHRIDNWYWMVFHGIAWYWIVFHSIAYLPTYFSKFLEGPIDKVFVHCCQGKLYPAYASSKLCSDGMPIYIDFFIDNDIVIGW